MDSGRAHRLGQAVASVLAEQQPTGAAGTAGVAAEPAVAADPAAAEQQPGAAAGPTDSAGLLFGSGRIGGDCWVGWSEPAPPAPVRP